ncbi:MULTISPECIES: hypothetical protein [unclassified Sphingomonas]|uniref:hypothetical protein n=1 Tax=unclassified Sphingomonas TaxID=196159 RepID=UPI00226AEF4E|nr:MULTISPECIES: hypothetical protein [unclassified Sphingomonas]
MSAPWPLFEVSFEGGARVLAARSRSAAMYGAYLDLSDIWDLTFRQWLGMAKAKRIDATPPGDPYEYVRRNYDRDLHHGIRVTITGEGRDLEGRAGTVIHPGRPSTAYAHVVLDGDRHAIIVHPFSVKVEG